MRPVQQYTKLCPARKQTNLKSCCQGFAAFIACSTQVLYTRLQPVFANLAAGCSGAWNSSQLQWTQTQDFCVVGVYKDDLEKPQNCQNRGMGACPGTLWYLLNLWDCYKEYSPLAYMYVRGTWYTCSGGSLVSGIGGRGGVVWRMTAIGHFNTWQFHVNLL